MAGQRSSQLNYVPTRQNQEIPRTRLEKLAGFLWYCARCHWIYAASNRFPLLRSGRFILTGNRGILRPGIKRASEKLAALGKSFALLLLCRNEN
jgi:hypothetical protein